MQTSMLGGSEFQNLSHGESTATQLLRYLLLGAEQKKDCCVFFCLCNSWCSSCSQDMTLEFPPVFGAALALTNLYRLTS